MANHPRILLSPAVLARAKDRVQSGHKFWTAVQSRAASEPESDSDIINVALAYALTGTASYADRAIAGMANLASKAVTIIDRDAGYDARTLLPAMALGFDWCYDRLTPAQRQSIGAKMVAWSERIWTETGGGLAAHWGDWPAVNYWHGDQATWMAGLALTGEGVNAERLAAQALARHKAKAMPWMATKVRGGYIEEGTGYGMSGSLMWAAHYLTAALTTGTAPAEILPPEWYPSVLRAMIHMTTPDRRHLYPGGDQARVSSASISDYSLAAVLSMMDYLSTEDAGMARYWFDELYPAREVIGWTAWMPLLWYRDDVPAIDYRVKLGTFYAMPGTGAFSARSSWAADAVQVVGVAGPVTEDHQDQAGHVHIVRGADTLAGMQKIWNASGIEHEASALNVVAIGDQSQNAKSVPKALFAADTPAATSWGADLTNTYDTLDEWRRELLFIRPNITLVWDRVKTKSAATEKRWQLHTQASPTTAGSMVRAVSGGSALFSTTVLPAGAAISRESVGASWRTNVRASGVALTHFLHVLEAAPSSQSQPSQITVGAMVGSNFTLSVGGVAVSCALDATTAPGLRLAGSTPPPPLPPLPPITMPNNYFVSPQGNDQNSGTSESQPWRSLSAIRRIPAGANTVTLEDGVWREPLPLASGLTVRARNPGKAIISGSSPTTLAWTKGPDGIWRATWPGTPPHGLFLGTYEKNGPYCCVYDGRYAGFDLTRPGGKVIQGSKAQWMWTDGVIQLTTINGDSPNLEALIIATGDGAITLDGLADVHLDGLATSVWRYAVGSDGGKNIALTNCVFTHNAQTGVWLTRIDGVEVTGCRVLGGGSLQAHAEDAMHLVGGKAKIQNTEVAWGGHGLAFCDNSGAFTFQGNHLHDSGGSGITVARGINDMVIDSNWIERCATQRSPSVRDVGAALQLHGDRHQVKNNVLKANSKHVLMQSEGKANPSSSNCLFDRNTLIDAEETAIEYQENTSDTGEKGIIQNDIWRASIISGAGFDLLSLWFAGAGNRQSNQFQGCQINRGRIRGTLGTFDTVEAAAAANPSVYASCSSGPLANTGSTLTAPPVVGGGTTQPPDTGGGGTVPTTPQLVRLIPASGPAGTIVRAEGSLFGSDPAVIIRSGTPDALRLTGLGGSDTAVVFTVPLGTPAGAMNVFVRNGIQSTNTLPFTVTGSTPPPPVNKPPVANAGGPYTGTVGVPVMFNGIHSSDPDGTITGYRWEFGDGSALSAVAPLHTYTSPGTYAVTLTVTDDKGATGVAQTTATITGLVTPPPATLKVGVALESKPTGGIAVVQITDAAPLPAGSTGTFTIKTPDGRTATGTATIAGTLPPPPPPLPPASNGIDEVFEFKGTPVEQALLRAGLWEHFPWGSLKPGLQRVGLTRVRCEFADLSWVGAAMTTDDNRLIIRASMENDEGEEELFHAVWSGMLPGSDPNEPRQTVAGLAWSSGLLQVEQSIKNDQALVKLVAGFEASHMADFFLMSLPGDGPGSIHARLLALAFAPGSVTGKWWAGSYPSSAYFQSVGESWMSGMGMAYGDGVQEDRRFSPFFKAGDAATIREILGLSRI